MNVFQEEPKVETLQNVLDEVTLNNEAVKLPESRNLEEKASVEKHEDKKEEAKLNSAETLKEPLTEKEEKTTLSNQVSTKKLINFS